MHETSEPALFKVRSVARVVGVSVVAAALGAATSVALALESARRHPLGANAGREAVRFPGAIPPELRAPLMSATAPATAPRPEAGADVSRSIIVRPIELDPMRCGLVAVREDRLGALDVRVSAGAVLRVVDDTFDYEEGAVERVVPAWARDLAVPWGWNGPWQMGQRAVAHVQATGWPWPALASLSRPQFMAASGPSGWQPVHGRAIAGTTTGARVWPTIILWPGLLADTAIWAAAWAALVGGAITGTRRLRRRRRIARGQCTTCGYARAGSNHGPCPECGVEAERVG